MGTVTCLFPEPEAGVVALTFVARRLLRRGEMIFRSPSILSEENLFVPSEGYGNFPVRTVIWRGLR